MNAIDVILSIADRIELFEEFEFASLPFAPSLEERGRLRLEDLKVVKHALNLRESLKTPFWDSVMISGARADSVPTGVLEAAVFHQALGENVLGIRRIDLSHARLHELCDNAFRTGRLLGITSAVRMMDGGTKHMPLLDFHITYSDYATSLVSDVLRLLGISGDLLSSGKSYHFYGHVLFNELELMSFLGKALLFSPIIDRVWIAHQLIERRCVLRISSREDYGGPPCG